MIISRHDDHGFKSAREVPEARQGLPIGFHLQDQVRQ
jgi:hypothetical protein